MRLQETIAYQDLINTLTYAIELKGPTEIGHSIRVSKLAVIVSEKLGFNKQKIELVKLSGLLHDIGKLGIPDKVLFKPSKLSNSEFRIMKMHSLFSYQILNKIEWPNHLKDLPAIVLDHHEYLDGSGYPLGKKEIKLETQIITVCDIFDALSSMRHYKKRRAFEEIIKILKNDSRDKLNSKIVRIILNLSLFDLLQIIEPKSIKEDISSLASYRINDLSDPIVSSLFDKYYYHRYLREKTKSFLNRYLKNA